MVRIVMLSSTGMRAFALCLFGVVFSTGVAAGVLITVAGGTVGDGGPASEADVVYPQGVFVDDAGNIYISDTQNNRIRKVDAAGIITTVVGNGSMGVSGDGGPATLAEVTFPTGIFIGGSGNFYFCENRHIRKVNPSGIISTLAGGGRYRGSIGDGGPATAAYLRRPTNLLVDSAGNLYFVDSDFHRVRRVDAVSGRITTVAGRWGDRSRGQFDGYDDGGFSGDGGPAIRARLNGPRGIFLDDSGNLYIADSGNHRIRKVDPSDVITTVAGRDAFGDFSGDGGPATEARLGGPGAICMDDSGNLYLSDGTRVRKIDRAGIITTVAGNGGTGYSGDGGPATEASLNDVLHLQVARNGDLYIASRMVSLPIGGISDGVVIRKVDASGILTTVAVAGRGGRFGPLRDDRPATEARLRSPRAIFVDGRGNLYIADAVSHRIQKVDASGILTTLAGSGDTDYAVGRFSGDGGPATEARLRRPEGVVADEAGNVYFSDEGNNRIRKVDPSGILTTVAGSGPAGPSGGGFSGDGGPATQALLNSPAGICMDALGNLFVADRFNRRVRKVDPSGIITTVAGNGESGFSGDGLQATRAAVNVQDIYVDGEGNLYISGGNRVRKVDAKSRVITTVAGNGVTRPGLDGNGVSDFSGDRGPATNAQLNGPRGIALDGLGNLYIADGGNNRIRKVDRRGIITTIVGNGTRNVFWKQAPASEASLHLFDIAIDRAGNLYMTAWYDRSPSRILKAEGITAPFLAAETRDFNGDRRIDFADFLIFARSFGKKQGDSDFHAKSDLNGDGEVDFSDFVLFSAAFGKVF